jgi:hypothetical protein
MAICVQGKRHQSLNRPLDTDMGGGHLFTSNDSGKFCFLNVYEHFAINHCD